MKKITQKVMDALIKKEAPIVAQARRKLWKLGSIAAKKRRKIVKPMTMKGEDKMNKYLNEVTDLSKALGRDEFDIISYETGELKLMFGPEVPDLVKKRAMDWAKRKGLRVKETSLGKSSDGFEWILLG